MYDYISLYSDEKYSGKIKSDELEKYLQKNLELKKVSTLKFVKELNGKKITITGVLADENGNYAFNSLDDIEAVNLIEIDIPSGIDETIEDAITKLSISIAGEFSWCVFDHETSTLIYP